MKTGAAPPTRLRLLQLPIALSAAGLLAGCDFQSSRPDGDADSGAPAEQQLKPPAVIPAPQAELGRTELLQAVSQAASAFATGTNDVVAQTALAGRRFTLRLRFGCEGPLPELEGRGLGWSYDEEEQRLQVRAAPNLIIDPEETEEPAGSESAQASQEAAVEAVEGFWIPRPWILIDGCPAPLVAPATGARPAAAPTAETAPRPEGTPAAAAAPREAAPRPTVGIAQYFTTGESRVTRRSGRAYETTVRSAPEAVPAAEGFNLVLRGRLRVPPGGKVIQCSAESPDIPPQCILSAEFDEISVENARTGERLADWRAS